jgi:hypothetical protein
MSINGMTNGAISRMFPHLKGKFSQVTDGINGMTDKALQRVAHPKGLGEIVDHNFGGLNSINLPDGKRVLTLDYTVWRKVPRTWDEPGGRGILGRQLQVITNPAGEVENITTTNRPNRGRPLTLRGTTENGKTVDGVGPKNGVVKELDYFTKVIDRPWWKPGGLHPFRPVGEEKHLYLKLLRNLSEAIKRD